MAIMRNIVGAFAASALALSSTVATAQNGDLAAQQAEWDQMPDTPGDGPFPAVMEVDSTLGDYVVYRPANLAQVGPGRLGLFVWGNGACADDGASARQHLAQIASHGYLVIAPGKWRSGPNAKAARAPRSAPATDGKIPAPPTNAANLRTALEWALSENARPNSQYAGLIDQDAIAVGGFSCGGLQALELAADPRVDTLVMQNSGVFNPGTDVIAGMTLTKDALAALHTPVLYLLGGPTDIAYANGTDDFRRIGNVPAVMVNIPTGHGGTYNEPMGGIGARIVTDWLQWQLRNDSVAEKSFVGEDCKLCVDPKVEIERKNFP